MDILGDEIYNEVYIPKHLPTFLHQYVQSSNYKHVFLPTFGFPEGNVTFCGWKSCSASTHQRTHIPTTFTHRHPSSLRSPNSRGKAVVVSPEKFHGGNFQGSGRRKKLKHPLAPGRDGIFVSLSLRSSSGKLGRIFPRDVSNVHVFCMFLFFWVFFFRIDFFTRFSKVTVE